MQDGIDLVFFQQLANQLPIARIAQLFHNVTADVTGTSGCKNACILHLCSCGN